MDQGVEQHLESLVLESPFWGSLILSVPVHFYSLEEPSWSFSEGELSWYLPTEELSAKLTPQLLKESWLDLFQFFQDLPVPSDRWTDYLYSQWIKLNPLESQKIEKALRLRLLMAAEQPESEQAIHQISRKGFRSEFWLAPDDFTLPWPEVLRKFARSCLGTRAVFSNRRISKRYGTSPGIRIMNIPNLIIGIDCSGSIHNDLVNRFWEEIYHLHRLPTAIKAITFDHRLLDVFNYHPKRSPRRQGGGGTDFNVPMEWANKHRAQAMVILTDGKAFSPEVKPRMPVLWLVVSDAPPGNMDQLPGKVVFIRALSKVAEKNY